MPAAKGRAIDDSNSGKENGTKEKEDLLISAREEWEEERSVVLYSRAQNLLQGFPTIKFYEEHRRRSVDRRRDHAPDGGKYRISLHRSTSRVGPGPTSVHRDIIEK